MKPQPTETSQTMWLSEVSISNFRSCDDTTIQLNPGLTLLLGENNAGKSNIIDAIRLGLDTFGGRPTRYFETADLRDSNKDIVISTQFTGATDYQKSLFISALDLSTGSIQYQIQFIPPSPQLQRGKKIKTAGPTRGKDYDGDNRSLLNHVYIEPLRDAKRELDSANGRRLAVILNALLSDEQKESLLEQANESNKQLKSQDGIQQVQREVQKNLTQITRPLSEQHVELSFEEQRLEKLARGLRFKMAEQGMDPGDLTSSGLGYANLLFLSTILLELAIDKDSQLTVLLIEEPEAHLHPQLQVALLNFLRARLEESSSTKSRPLQIIISTHSPTLASAAGVETFVAVKAHTSKGTKCINFKHILDQRCVNENDLRKINQYLDVTRSQLLFAKRVLLVEGISEAVLLPAIAERIYANDNDRLQRFKTTEIVVVGSVDLGPYMTLLDAKVEGVSFIEKWAILTDGDPSISDKSAPPAGQQRSQNLNRDHNDETSGKVFTTNYTLEVDLLGDKGENETTLEKVYLQQHPNSKRKWDEVNTAKDKQRKMYDLMCAKTDSTNLNIRKGQFAHDLALMLREHNADGYKIDFTCPETIRDVLDFITDKENA